MDPAPQFADRPAPPGAVAEEGLQRFEGLLASQFDALRGTLVASFERELFRAVQQAAESERVGRLAAEVDVRRLELEVESLRCDGGSEPRRRRSAPPAASPASESGSEGEEADTLEDDSPEGRSPALAARLAAPTAVTLAQGSLAHGTPRIIAHRPSVRERLETVPGAPPLMPTRIPKPTRAPAKSLSGEPCALEDLDDPRVARHSQARPCSGSPVPVASQGRSAEERSTTPSIKSRARRAATQEEDVLGMRSSQTRVGLMQDKRTLRKINRDVFRTAIQEWRENHRNPGGKARKTQACQVFVRLRPMFEKEWQQGDFEAVTAYQEWGEVIVHNCLFQADLVRMFIHHVGFCFPRSFGADASNEEVYAECGSPLVAHALGGQLSTIFMFGQTGSGKTYTMSTIIEMAAQEIFAAEREPPETCVRLRAFEIAGKKCFDLLSRPRAELKLLESDDGRTNIMGALEAFASSAEELQRAFREAFSRRATASHGRNEESSRSHCICIVELPAVKGSLVLVDCAGTERRQDTDQHSAERTKESAEINSSLHALKECIRYRAKEQRQAKASGEEDRKQVHVPYRGSYLTRVLHESFTRPGSRLTAIGTVAPAATDVEHTLSTLRTLQLLLSESGNSDAPNFEQRLDVDPKAHVWTARARRAGTASELECGGPKNPQATPGSANRRTRADTDGQS